MSAFLKYRSNEQELMDDLSSGGPVIEQTLRELEVINRLLGGNHVTINGLNKLISTSDRLTVIDLGCGGGDMLKLVCDWGRKKKIDLQVIGIDANRNIVEYARKNTAEYPEISYLAMDIFSEEFLELKCDIFITTLFMHHFTNEQIISMLKRLKNQASKGLVINDLHRHWFAYHSIRILTGILSRSEMVRNDAAVSVERSFLRNELSSMFYEAHIPDFNIRWYWAFRWQVVARFS